MGRKNIPLCLCLNRDEFHENLKGHTREYELVRSALSAAPAGAEGEEPEGSRRGGGGMIGRGTAGERERGKGPRRRWSKE